MSAESSNSREKILEVAEALFARRGYSGVGMREVAEAAGLGKSSLFHHFRSKPQLYFEALAAVVERIQHRLAPLMAAESGPVEKLDRLIDGWIDALAEHPTTARLLLRALFEEEEAGFEELPEAERCERMIAETLDGIARLLRSGVEAGAIRPVSVAETLQTLIGASVYHFASGEFGETLLGRPLFAAESIRRRKEELRQLLHHGLVASPA